MIRSQEKKKEILAYMQEHKPHLIQQTWRIDRIKDCCNLLRFLNLGLWVTKLYKGNFCKYDKMCLACATRRSIKKIQHFEQWIIKNWLQNKHWYHITLTLKHSSRNTLEELMDKLFLCRKRLSQHIRNSKRENQTKKSFFSQFSWMVASVEVTHGKSWRHPHMHVLVCSDYEIPVEYSKALWTLSNRSLQKEWFELTGDSFCVAMRKVDVSKHHFDRQWIAEVFKYAVKFTSLDTPQLVELIDLQEKRQYRFYATYGIFRGRDNGGEVWPQWNSINAYDFVTEELSFNESLGKYTKKMWRLISSVEDFKIQSKN